MKRCPNCGAHREDDADYCGVCGETFPGPGISELSGPRWYNRPGYMVAFVVLLWPMALYGLYQRDQWDQNRDQWLLAGCIVMAAVWALVLR
jgi:predicted amidophosphoribosyltransferase